MGTLPKNLPEWADATTNILEPAAGKKAAGWLFQEDPASNFMNWWMNNVFQWASYLSPIAQGTQIGALGPGAARTTPSSMSGVAGVAYNPAGGAFGMGRVVIVGNNGAGTPVIQTSDDWGRSWTAQTSHAGTSNLFAVAWNGAQFVAVGQAGVIVTSADGATWVAQTSGTANDLTSLAWSPTAGTPAGIWVVPEDSSGNVVTSHDGVTWSSHSTGAVGASLPYVVWAAGPALFLLSTGGTATNQVSSSPDGTTWTPHTVTGFAGPALFLTYAPLVQPSAPAPLFIAFQNVASVITAFTSPDAVNWTNAGVVPLSPNGSTSVFFDQSCFVFANNGLMRTRDGVTYTPMPTQANSLAGLVQGFGGFLMIGSGGSVFWSATSTPYP